MGMVDDDLNVTSNTKCRTILITEHTCVPTWVVSIWSVSYPDHLTLQYATIQCLRFIFTKHCKYEAFFSIVRKGYPFK